MNDCGLFTILSCTKSVMVCDKCQDRLSKLAVPDVVKKKDSNNGNNTVAGGGVRAGKTNKVKRDRETDRDRDRDRDREVQV
jgi:hypothetical protein